MWQEYNINKLRVVQKVMDALTSIDYIWRKNFFSFVMHFLVKLNFITFCGRNKNESIMYRATEKGLEYITVH